MFSKESPLLNGDRARISGQQTNDRVCINIGSRGHTQNSYYDYRTNLRRLLRYFVKFKTNMFIINLRNFLMSNAFQFYCILEKQTLIKS